MEDLKFYGLTLTGLSISLLRVLNPYLEFGILVLTIVSLVVKIKKDSK